jgi:transposase
MRYELTNHEWAAIKPMLPNKPRGVPRVNDRRVLNGIFWVLRSGAPWRDLPQQFGPYTTCYNRFVRWRRAGVWGRIMNALSAAHDAAVQMIDTSIVRVHQHAACIARNRRQSMGRSRGGLTSKIHAVVDSRGLPVRLALTTGEAHDNRLAAKLLSRLKSGSMLLADRGYDADWIRTLVRQHGAWANIPPRAIEKTHSASARICTALEIWSNGSSTRSSSVGEWQHATTNSRPTTSPLFNLRQSAYSCGLMSPRPNGPDADLIHGRRIGPKTWFRLKRRQCAVCRRFAAPVLG